MYLERNHLFEILADFPRAHRVIRMAAFRIAFRRAFLKIAENVRKAKTERRGKLGGGIGLWSQARTCEAPARAKPAGDAFASPSLRLTPHA